MIYTTRRYWPSCELRADWLRTGVSPAEPDGTSAHDAPAPCSAKRVCGNRHDASGYLRRLALLLRRVEMSELNASTLSQLPPKVAAPSYDRSRLKRGIAHFGVGNFHRAHQAFYIDRLSRPARPGGLGHRRHRPGRRRAGSAEGRAVPRTGLPVFAHHRATEGRTRRARDRRPARLPARAGAAGRGARAVDQPGPARRHADHHRGRLSRRSAIERFRHRPPGRGPRPRRREPRTVFGFVTEALARRRAAGIDRSPWCRATTCDTTAKWRALPSSASPARATRNSAPGSMPTSPFPTRWSTASRRRCPRKTLRASTRPAAWTTASRWWPRTSPSG